MYAHLNLMLLSLAMNSVFRIINIQYTVAIISLVVLVVMAIYMVSRFEVTKIQIKLIALLAMISFGYAILNKTNADLYFFVLVALGIHITSTVIIYSLRMLFIDHGSVIKSNKIKSVLFFVLSVIAYTIIVKMTISGMLHYKSTNTVYSAGDVVLFVALVLTPIIYFFSIYSITVFTSICIDDRLKDFGFTENSIWFYVIYTFIFSVTSVYITTQYLY